MKLKLQDIVVHKDMQSRDSIDENVVNEYAEAMERGDKFPPLVVFNDGDNHYLTDGFTRYFAMMKVGTDEADVIVHKGTRRQAEIFSWGVNDKHGQPRSNATKRMIVMKALDDPEFADKDAREIARIVNLSHTYIINIRNELNKPKPKTANKPADKPHKPVDNVIEAPLEDPQDNMVKELADLNQELHEENQKYKDKELILSGDDAKVEETIESLRKEIKRLEMELNAVKNTRDQYQAKNVELVKSVNYWKRKYEKTTTA